MLGPVSAPGTPDRSLSVMGLIYLLDALSLTLTPEDLCTPGFPRHDFQVKEVVLGYIPAFITYGAGSRRAL